VRARVPRALTQNRLRLTRSRPIESNGQRRLGMFLAHDAAQVESKFPGPGLGGLVRRRTHAQVGRQAAL
jgi:hypothetical protein